MFKVIGALYLVYYVVVCFATTQALTNEQCNKAINEKIFGGSPLAWPMADGCIIKTIKVVREGNNETR